MTVSTVGCPLPRLTHRHARRIAAARPEPSQGVPRGLPGRRRAEVPADRHSARGFVPPTPAPVARAPPLDPVYHLPAALERSTTATSSGLDCSPLLVARQRP